MEAEEDKIKPIAGERHDDFLRRLARAKNPDRRNQKNTDPVSRPAHYNIGGIEPAEFMESIGIAEDYYAGNIIKYASRYKRKNGVEDIKKAKQYCKMLIDLLDSSDAN